MNRTEANAAGGKPAVHLEGVEKHYRGRCVVRLDVLDFAPGERVLVSGSNGSGKSTLLRLVIGATSPDKGRIEISRETARRGMGYAPQTAGLAPEQTISTSLALRRFTYGLPMLPAEEAWYVRRLGLRQFLDRQFWELSGGFQKLAAIAAALHVEPGCLILDEPFSGLDEAKREVLRDILNLLAPRLALLLVSSPTQGDSDGVEFGRTIELVQGRIS